jgi:hypothetical protein
MICMTKCDSRDRWTLAGRILLLGSVTLLAGAFCQFAFSATPGTEPKPKAGEPNTKPRSEAERKAGEQLARMGIVRVREDDPMGEGRAKRIAALVAIVRNTDLVAKDRTKVHNAILRLGRMKALEGAEALAERLDLHLTPSGRISSIGIPTPDQEYPAIKALVAIGEGALPHITDALFAQKRSAQFKRNALFAVIMIMDLDLAKTQKYLRRRLAMYKVAAEDLPKMLGNWVAVINMKDYSAPAPPEED